MIALRSGHGTSVRDLSDSSTERPIELALVSRRTAQMTAITNRTRTPTAMPDQAATSVAPPINTADAPRAPAILLPSLPLSIDGRLWEASTPVVNRRGVPG